MIPFKRERWIFAIVPMFKGEFFFFINIELVLDFFQYEQSNSWLFVVKDKQNVGKK